MKQKILNYVNNKILNQYFEIEENNDSLIFELKNKLPFSKNYLIIKHRKSGKRISIKFENSKVILNSNQLKRIDKIGIFDIYLKIIILNKKLLYRVKYNNQNIGKKIFDVENKFYFESRPTSRNNLSFTLKNCDFYPILDSIKKHDNGVILNGTINLANDVEFDDIELIAYSNKGGRKEFPCEYKTKNSKLLFKSDVIINFEENDIDSAWLFRLRLKKDDIIMTNYILKAFNLSNFEKNSDFLFEKIKCEPIDGLEPCINFYATYKFNFKFQIITETKYEKRIKSIETKDWYSKYKKDPLDKNIIFFESFHGKYNNNPKYIYEKMLELGFNKNYTLVWSYNGDETIPGNPIIVNSDNEDYYKFLAHAKYRISNATFPIVDTRPEIIYLQTWHGTPLKRLGYDIGAKTGIGWGHFNNEMPTWNYLISANKYSTKTFKRAFRFNKEILELGYPANDIFYRENDSLISEIKNKLEIDANKKIILYAPTFRDDKFDSDGNRYFDLELDLEYLSENLSDDYLLIIKLHSVVSESLELNENLKEFVIDCSNYEDIHELFIISDILITDYSSVFFDYAHSKRPILFFMSDMESYIASRGLYYEVFEELPGPQLINNKQILESIINIKSISEEYEDQYDKFYKKYCSIGHGDSSEKIIKRVFKEN